jgi:hypothetical protein
MFLTATRISASTLATLFAALLIATLPAFAEEAHTTLPVPEQSPPNTVLHPQSTVVIRQQVPTVRLKFVITDPQGAELIFVARHGAHWGLETTYALGQAGQYTGKVNEQQESYSTSQKLWAHDSRWIVLGTLRTEELYLESDTAFPVLVALDSERGLVYIAGKGLFRDVATGQTFNLGANHNFEHCLLLFDSESTKEREAAAWMAGFLELTKQQRITLQQKLSAMASDEQDRILKATAIESLGRIGDTSVIDVLQKIRGLVPRDLSTTDSILVQGPKIGLSQSIDWALANVRARAEGTKPTVTCPDCYMTGCAVHASTATESVW